MLAKYVRYASVVQLNRVGKSSCSACFRTPHRDLKKQPVSLCDKGVNGRKEECKFPKRRNFLFSGQRWQPSTRNQPFPPPSGDSAGHISHCSSHRELTRDVSPRATYNLSQRGTPTTPSHPFFTVCFPLVLSVCTCFFLPSVPPSLPPSRSLRI